MTNIVESALVIASDDGDVLAMMMLDLSAASDTVHHDILLPQLNIFEWNGPVLPSSKRF